MNILLKTTNNKEYAFISVNHINLNLSEKLNRCLSIEKFRKRNLSGYDSKCVLYHGSTVCKQLKLE